MASFGVRQPAVLGSTRTPIDWINDQFGELAKWAAILSCLISCGNALVRYTFSISSNGWLEVQWYLFAGCVMLGAAQVLRVNEHVRVDVLYAHFSPRKQLYVDLLSAALSIMISVIIIWLSLKYVQQAYIIDEKSSDPGGLTHRWVLKALIPLGFSFLILQSAALALGPGALPPYLSASVAATAGDNPAPKQEAQNLLQGMASVHGFYEQLALEELGQAILAPEKPGPLSAAERASVHLNPGLQRALYAIGIGLRTEGNREWNYTTNLHTQGGMSDRELLAAADLACGRQVWDRCINTSERTKEVIDLEQRFPMPLRETVVRRAGDIKLEPAFVYGLIRQESRFITDARSHVGASGLMQVMPATAKWTAKKIGMNNFQVQQLNEHETNVAIGTGYLKLVLDDFDGSMPLAAAAYNAGPSRSRRWRAPNDGTGPVLEGAIWAENVPFNETRDYVKKVLSNTTSYAALISGQPQSLKAKLGMVGPRDATAPAENLELP